MCGIAGILYKGSASDPNRSVGRDMIGMLESMRHRGADSTGVTILGESISGNLLLRLHAPKISLNGGNGHDPQRDDWIQQSLRAIEGSGAKILDRSGENRFLRLTLDYGGDVRDLAEALYGLPDVQIHSIGRCSEVIKDVGDADELETRHHVAALNGTHALGHVRLATESQVDITHSHPFWAFPFCDITVVHNGQLTNYHKMKRLFRTGGLPFPDPERLRAHRRLPRAPPGTG